MVRTETGISLYPCNLFRLIFGVPATSKRVIDINGLTCPSMRDRSILELSRVDLQSEARIHWMRNPQPTASYLRSDYALNPFTACASKVNLDSSLRPFTLLFLNWCALAADRELRLISFFSRLLVLEPRSSWRKVSGRSPARPFTISNSSVWYSWALRRSNENNPNQPVST